MTLGSYIRDTREAQGLKLQWVARQCGVSRQTLWMWERDDRSPSMEQLVSLAGVLGLDGDTAVRLRGEG